MCLVFVLRTLYQLAFFNVHTTHVERSDLFLVGAHEGTAGLAQTQSALLHVYLPSYVSTAAAHKQYIPTIFPLAEA